MLYKWFCKYKFIKIYFVYVPNAENSKNSMYKGIAYLLVKWDGESHKLVINKGMENIR